MRILYRHLLPIAVLALSATFSQAAELSSDAKSAIPKDVQQLIVVDYRAMQNSNAAMALKDRVLPPELKRLESALKNAKLNVDKDDDVLAFASFKDSSGQGTRIVGIAQGQFETQSILAGFAKSKAKTTVLRNNTIYPMGSAGMSVVFLDQTTMVYGDKSAVIDALNARDGIVPNFLTNGDMVNDMGTVDQRAIWSLLDAKGTQTMMRSVLGDAAYRRGLPYIEQAFGGQRVVFEDEDSRDDGYSCLELIYIPQWDDERRQVLDRTISGGAVPRR